MGNFQIRVVDKVVISCYKLHMIKVLGILLSLVLFIGATPTLAIPNLSNAALKTSGTQRTLILPPQAEISPVISLGSGIDPQTGKKVEGLAIIHYKNGFSHKPNHGGGNNPGSSCYTYISNGAKWKTVEQWVTNTNNTRGLPDYFILANLIANISKWEDATDGNVTNGIGLDVLGQGAST
ncbi:MAG: hypothetical protein AABY07_02235, partial [Nanoarchaeota archaeon]